MNSMAATPERSAPTARALGRFWTVANALSLLRVVVVIPIVWLILTDGPMGWLFGLIAFGIVTDFFDGRLARWTRSVSDWGKVLDPLADKVAAASITFALAVREPPAETASLPYWLLGLIVFRDALIVAGGVVLARRTGQVVMSLWSGKVAVTALAVTILAALLQADVPVLMACVYLTAALLLYSFVRYVIRFLRLLRADAATPPPEAGPVREEPSP